MFKIRKDHLRIIFFLKSLFWVGNIYEIYANLTVMTLLNLSHFLVIAQAELCLKGTEVSFLLPFLDIYQNPRRKNFTNPSCSEYCKRINWNKKWQFLFSHVFVVPHRGSTFLRHWKELWEKKKFISFFPLENKNLPGPFMPRIVTCNSII